MQRRSWFIAFAIAGALHLVAAAAIFWPRERAGVEAPGVGGIEISLGAAGRAPGALATAGEAETEAENEEADVSSSVTAPEAAPVEPAPDPATAQDTKSVVEETVEKEQPPDPAPQSSSVQKSVASQVSPSQDAGAAERASAPGAGGEAGEGDRAESGDDGDDVSGGGVPGAEADYAAVLLAWLERHKRYPRPAQRRGQEGTVLLYILIDRDGQVLQSRIEESSGYPLLDQAALDMLERAAPVPPMPDHMSQERLELVIPVQFFMN